MINYIYNLRVVQLNPVQPALHLQTLGLTQIPALWHPCEHTAACVQKSITADKLSLHILIITVD